MRRAATVKSAVLWAVSVSANPMWWGVDVTAVLQGLMALVQKAVNSVTAVLSVLLIICVINRQVGHILFPIKTKSPEIRQLVG